MARRTATHAPEGREAAEALGQSVVDSAQQIWLAGLGAFARAKSEGDRVFDMLVEQGKGLRERARGAADQALKSVRAQTDGTVSQWDKLEQVFEDRVSRSLARLGVVTTREIEALTRQVEALNASVRAMSGSTARAARAAPKRKAAAKKKKRSSKSRR